jgi:CPA1 family monovalent cation:H+ antiporter
MIAQLEIGFFLLAAIAAIGVFANRLRLPPSILLVIAGAVLAMIPGLPRVELVPDLVLLLVLPPVIYSAGVSMSWREFRFNLRPIALLAIGAVVFTTCAVAAGVHWLLGWEWAVGFVLGAIVAPPDVVAPLAIARRLGLPRRLRVILEGEGLANDATALVLYRFAVVAVSTGAFSFSEASGRFALIIIGEIAFGIGIGWIMLRLRRAADDPRTEIILSLLTPYLAYWVPEQVGGSGVLATVAAGLYVSWNGPLLISAATRLQGVFVWDLAMYIVEGGLFLLCGLQARTVFERADGVAVMDLLTAAALTLAIIISARFVWTFPATYLPRWLSPALRLRDPSPKWQVPFVLAFTGIRGVVSLAAALAIPLTTAAGTPFPERDMILAITFIVIVVTLVGQGLLLPVVIRRLGFDKDIVVERREERANELEARMGAIQAALTSIDELSHQRKLSGEIVEALRHHYRVLLRELERAKAEVRASRIVDELEIEVIDAQRRQIHQALRDGRISDESRRRVERDLDLVETKTRHDYRAQFSGT